MGKKDSSLQPGGAAMLVLALLKEREMYGYQIIEELERRSNQVFQLKEGTLYPRPPQPGAGQAGHRPGAGDPVRPEAAVLPHHRRRPAGPGGEAGAVDRLLQGGDGHPGRGLGGGPP